MASENLGSLISLTSGAIEGAFLDVAGQRIVLLTADGSTFAMAVQVTQLDSTGDINAAGTVTADVRVDSPSHFAEVGGVSQEFTESQQLAVSADATWREAQQDGVGRRNDYLNSTVGASPTFTTTEDALRFRYHFSDYTLYWADNTTATIGAAVTWQPVMDFDFSSAGHSVAFNADMSVDNLAAADITCTTVDATTSVTTNTLQQNASGTLTDHNSDGAQTVAGSSIARRIYQNFSVTTGAIYHIRGTNSNDGYFRFDTTDSGGTLRSGTLTVGTGTNNYVGLRTGAPTYPVHANGDTRITGHLLIDTVAVASAPDNTIFRNSADGKFYIKAGGVAKLIVTSPVQ